MWLAASLIFRIYIHRLALSLYLSIPPVVYRYRYDYKNIIRQYVACSIILINLGYSAVRYGISMCTCHVFTIYLFIAPRGLLPFEGHFNSPYEIDNYCNLTSASYSTYNHLGR